MRKWFEIGYTLILLSLKTFSFFLDNWRDVENCAEDMRGTSVCCKFLVLRIMDDGAADVVVDRKLMPNALASAVRNDIQVMMSLSPPAESTDGVWSSHSQRSIPTSCMLVHA